MIKTINNVWEGNKNRFICKASEFIYFIYIWGIFAKMKLLPNQIISFSNELLCVPA